MNDYRRGRDAVRSKIESLDEPFDKSRAEPESQSDETPMLYGKEPDQQQQSLLPDGDVARQPEESPQAKANANYLEASWRTGVRPQPDIYRVERPLWLELKDEAVIIAMGATPNEPCEIVYSGLAHEPTSQKAKLIGGIVFWYPEAAGGGHD